MMLSQCIECCEVSQSCSGFLLCATKWHSKHVACCDRSSWKTVIGSMRFAIPEIEPSNIWLQSQKLWVLAHRVYTRSSHIESILAHHMHIASFTHIARFHTKCTPHRMHMNIACIHITCTCALICRCATTQHASIIDSLFAALLQLASHMAHAEGPSLCLSAAPSRMRARLSVACKYVCMYVCIRLASLSLLCLYVCMHVCMYSTCVHLATTCASSPFASQRAVVALS